MAAITLWWSGEKGSENVPGKHSCRKTSSESRQRARASGSATAGSGAMSRPVRETLAARRRARSLTASYSASGGVGASASGWVEAAAWCRRTSSQAM